MHTKKRNTFLAHGVLILFALIASCSGSYEEEILTPPTLGDDIVYLPVVVHVIHSGKAEGEESNLSTERIIRQIEILNEDFRKKPGTRGFNEHPEGGDSKIEFVLAKRAPDGSPTDGINRVDTTIVNVPILGYGPNHYAQYAYWPSSEYINIWTTPLPMSTACLAAGMATGPLTDLPGTQHMAIPHPGDAEGILINWIHFGESQIDCQARFGRTLTHEMGHYFGLLHTWGGQVCELNDYCEDTPAVDKVIFGNTEIMGCQGTPVMLGNYMNYTDDEIMNIFTKDQIARMHYVLENHPGRNALMSSPALESP